MQTKLRLTPFRSARQVLVSVLLASAVGALASPRPVSADDPKPFAFGKTQVEDFVNFQFDNYFTNCEQFLTTFANEFEYCDGQPCISDRQALLAACQATQGAQNHIVRLDVLPASYPDPFKPDYSKIAATGLQTVFLSIPGTPSFPEPFPLCFNFSISETLKRDRQSPFGFSSKSWKGSYTVAFGPCQ